MEYALLGIIILLIILGIIYLVLKKVLKIRNNKNIDIIIMFLTIVLIPFLYYISIHYSYRPGWDIDIILKNIEYMLSNNTDKIMHGYYSRYANNLYITYIFLNIYKLSLNIGIQNGYFLLLLIQSIMFSLGGLLIYKIANMYFKERYKIYSVYTWILYILLVGLSPHIVLTYTDGIGMFLSLLLTYIIFKIENIKMLKKNKKIIIKMIFILLFTNLTIISYYIKPQIIIISIAYVIIKLLNMLRIIIKTWKNKYKIQKDCYRDFLKNNIYYVFLIILVIVTGTMTYLSIR